MHFTLFSSVSIVDFEQVNVYWVVSRNSNLGTTIVLDTNKLTEN